MRNENWYSFIRSFRRKWRFGEHVSIVGPTGAGKSFLALEILKERQYVVLLLTKGRDATLDRYIRENDYTEISSWQKASPFDERIALWPRFSDVRTSYEHQARVFKEAISGSQRAGQGIFKAGVWTVYIDEVAYFADQLHIDRDLNLDKEMSALWTQGRSNEISVVASTQRPVNVPRLMWTQWRHLFAFQTTDKDEIDNIARIGGNISSVIRENVPHLREFEFLYINRLKPDDAVISKVEGRKRQ